MIFTEGTGQYPLYIFDLDGTLALIEHRRHFVTRPVGNVRGWEANWKAFYEACDRDQPNWPVIGTMLQLYSVGCDVRIWSAREDSVRGKTMMWLHTYTRIPLIKLEQMLKMRSEGDYTPDEQLKRKWLNLMTKQERNRVCAVFDDRNKVVDMWRGEGVPCFQVAQGDF